MTAIYLQGLIRLLIITSEAATTEPRTELFSLSKISVCTVGMTSAVLIFSAAQ